MFTGLILEMGEIISMKRRSGGAVLSLKSREVSSDSKVGYSISVNGVCLTVANKDRNELSFDLSEETLRSTNLGSLKAGDIVNLEPSLTPDTRIGGHFVTGHVDAVGKIRTKANEGDMLKFGIEVPSDIIDFLVEKGSVALDGISLTVIDILKDSFTVVIIPHTAKMTTLGFKGHGDTVNIEADILGKYVARFLSRREDKNSKFMRTLMREGYT
ncbi:MAG: riboflavin synthase [Nitrospirae bacterium]|nr:riboflavin synthase [Nitrospirota bacterium]